MFLNKNTDRKQNRCSKSKLTESKSNRKSKSESPKTKVDQDKLGKALKSLSDEDPTFRVRTDEETAQTVISGMGELHLEILVDRMQREFGVDATVGKPQVAYRETVTKKVETVEYRHIKQSGGSGQFAVVKIDLESSGIGGGYQFVDDITGGRV